MKKQSTLVFYCISVMISLSSCSKENISFTNSLSIDQSKTSKVNTYSNKPSNRIPGPTGVKINFSYNASKPTSTGITTVSFQDETKLSLDCTDAWTITGWKWNFGDGGTSTLPNPTHDYTSLGGTYKVALEVIFTSATDGHTAPVTFTKDITF